MIKFFAESEDYRKRVASHNVLAAQNHLRFGQPYKANSIEVLRLIDERFGSKKSDWCK